MPFVHRHLSKKQIKSSIISGFSLIELLIVISIVGILTMVALPTYQEHVTKTRRVDGKAALMMIMAIEERYMIRNNQYIDTLGPGVAGAGLNLTVDAADQFTTDDGFYLISASYCVASDTSCILLTATPQNGQAGDGNITLNSQGIKTPAAYW
ncbi:MAG: prepilin-type N-terminal cleavage/methylation domain-containing protein [Magnetococcales bacterium]|nr:prepilin-type N-terminal cleavage/methylation domain-containing protein [Magnetococcales bacterium]